MSQDILLAFAVMSVLGNFYLGFQLSREMRRPKKRGADMTAADMLHDLTRRGQAILKVEVIDQENLLLRSPRG